MVDKWERQDLTTGQQTEVELTPEQVEHFRDMGDCPDCSTELINFGVADDAGQCWAKCPKCNVLWVSPVR